MIITPIEEQYGQHIVSNLLEAWVKANYDWSWLPRAYPRACCCGPFRSDWTQEVFHAEGRKHQLQTHYKHKYTSKWQSTRTSCLTFYFLQCLSIKVLYLTGGGHRVSNPTLTLLALQKQPTWISLQGREAISSSLTNNKFNAVKKKAIPALTIENCRNIELTSYSE